MSYFTYTDLINSLLNPKLIDPGSTLSHVVHTTLLVSNIVKRECYVS